MSTANRLFYYLDLINQEGEQVVVDRVHPHMATHAQGTGRWSITKPPLQQTPTDLLTLFSIDPGYVGMGWDFDQLHLRIIAAEAGDHALIKALTSALDIHTLNACDLFGLDYPNNRKDPHKAPEDHEWRLRYGWEGKEDPRRSIAKRFVYRLLKGADPRQTANIPGLDACGLTPQAFKAASLRWINKHPAIIAYQDSLRDRVKRGVPVYDFKGRMRYFWSPSAHNQRAGTDFPAQGGEVEVMNLTLVEVMDATRHLGVRFMYQRHDYAQIAIPQEHVAQVGPRVRAIVQRTWTIRGTTILLPATFYRIDANGQKHPWIDG